MSDNSNTILTEMTDAELGHAMGTLLLLTLPGPGETDGPEPLSPVTVKACRLVLAEADKRGIIGQNTFALTLIEALETEFPNA
ncbi:hypothetical protein [Acidocella aminolytica]|uniref:Uncharacterized protein n=1 Tax=Acidocella aminolytica 101 = DSM 11237 TaxID=1120923 RepID=A0A0D6PF89_9PROT|nr:hypothetical protein [Acidocella aminolytica]GAN80415.1 hypothetical protein Aam_046_056 [Acidocella aminolytica 101 = DSM 11237]GBQ36247.1 hypothetical protein AA11237_1192 [Acidocella aminolytica 101 = DSM 11237]SHF45106.1 hypothetical protein SAMN02746095_03312 [Acidocella aminolytica 101 = DSM 11237]